MLYGYPAEAVEDNWLHDCLCDVIVTVHRHNDLGGHVPSWPDVLSAVYRQRLARRTGLRDRITKYADVLSDLSVVERAAVLEALDEQNRIGDLISAVCDCPTADDLPELIREPLRHLFEFGFELLRELGVRDELYRVIYESSEGRVCPFCGTEAFDAPYAPREPLDHYLNKARYPLAAVNLLNLVPMGPKCNSKYKLAQDILRRGDGSRRRSFNPYDHSGVKVSLEGSQPFGDERAMPAWQINFDPPTEEAETWDEVFRIRERYRRDVLEPDYRDWLREFSMFARRNGVDPDDKEGILSEIKRLEGLYLYMGLADRGFLRAEVFRMLREQCEAANQRLLLLLRNLITSAS